MMMTSQRTRSTASIWTLFLGLAIATFGLLLLSAWLENVTFRALTDPLGWLASLDAATVFDVLGNAAEVIAGVLGIAITVVAIVVELAANRYSHEITGLFLRDPWNLAALSMFVITALMCVWVAATLGGSTEPRIANAGFGVTLALVTLSLLALLPYFAYVFLFISPINVIRRIRRAAVAAAGRQDRDRLVTAVDQLQDVSRSALGQGDRSVAMACVAALAEFMDDYRGIKGRLSEDWFQVDEIHDDPDFVALEATSLKEIEAQRLWVEVKVMRQYLTLLALSVPASRDVANVIGISTKEMGIAAAAEPELLNLHIRCFNSYIRATLNARDPRTTYYLMNQYRLLAEHLQADARNVPLEEIAGHLCFYGQLGHNMGMPFLLEVAAHDLVQLITGGIDDAPELVDLLLTQLLELDMEIKHESQEESLLGVRRAQLQLATLLVERGDGDRVAAIVKDLKAEQPRRLEQLYRQLMQEDREQYWEFTDRGVNFAYLPPERRKHLAAIYHQIGITVNA